MGARWRYAYVGEVYESKDGWRWRVVARNGQPVATCHEGYNSRAYAIRMCRKVCRVRRVIVVDR